MEDDLPRLWFCFMRGAYIEIPAADSDKAEEALKDLRKDLQPELGALLAKVRRLNN